MELNFANNSQNFANALSETTFPQRSFISFGSVVPRLQYFFRTESELEKSLKAFFQVEDVSKLHIVSRPFENSRVLVAIFKEVGTKPVIKLLLDTNRNIISMGIFKGEVRLENFDMEPKKNVYRSEVENLLMAFSLANELSAMR